MEIPGFEQSEKIAETGFASYWKAYQRSLDRHVTLIVLRPDAVADEKARRSFLRDIRIVSGLKHPALFQIFDVMELDATLIVIVEHLSGQTLRHYVRQRGMVRGEKALTIGRWVAEGLSHVYEKTGLVHLALTPDQIWINGEGEVKILGFGFSTIFEHVGYSSADVPFLSPEQVRHQTPYEFQSDVFSLGSVLYYMLTGRVPFEGNSPEQMLGLIVDGQLPAPAGEGITSAHVQLLARMLSKEPEYRYNGWLPVMQEMDKILDGAKFLSGIRKTGKSTILLAAGSRPAPAATVTPAPAAPVSSSSILTTLFVLIVVLAFWGWLGLTLWRLPPPAAPPAASPAGAAPYVELRHTLSADQNPAARVRVVRTPNRAGVPATAESQADSPASETGAESPAPDNPPSPAVSNPAPAVSAAPSGSPAAALPAFEKLTDDVVRHLAAGQADKAAAVVAAAGKGKQADLSEVRLDELRRLVSRCGDSTTLVLTALRQKIGEKVKLPMGGRAVEVTINRIEGQSVVVSEAVQHENVPVKKYFTLEPARMGPGDQVQVLALGTGPEFAVARIQVYLKGGARERAAAVAAETGMLAPAFQRFFAGAAP